jgi:SAM-dependent methyltransferase
MSNQRDYVAVVYNEQDRPFTAYPDELARYLWNRYSIQPGTKVLDIGCGRGEFLRGFMRCGAKGYGVDRSRAAETLCPEAELRIADLENDLLPFEDDFFDVVFSKSVIEHFYYPEKLVKEIYRVLKPGGLVITMCPDWEYNMRIYFEDYTHRTPFTLSSLRDIQLIHSFDHVQSERFRQLPVLWKYHFLLPLVELTRILVPRFLSSKSKFVRFSKEIMLLSSSIKPQSTSFREIL